MLIKKETHGNFQHQLFIALFLLVMILLIGEVLADNRSDQMNPNNDAIARGNNERSGDSDSSEYSDYKDNRKN